MRWLCTTKFQYVLDCVPLHEGNRPISMRRNNRGRRMGTCTRVPFGSQHWQQLHWRVQLACDF